MADSLQQQIYREAFEARDSDRLFPHATLGAYTEPFSQWAQKVFPAQSFLASDLPLEKWRSNAREALMKILGRMPPRPKLETKTISVIESNDLRIEKLQYQLPYGPATEALFLTPLKSTEKLRACLALHDHGGFKYYGKDKVTHQPHD